MTNYSAFFTPTTLSQMFIVFGIAYYFLECFAGYRFIKLFITIAGFFVGFVIGFIASLSVYQIDAYIPTIIGILAGVLLAIIAFRLYLAGVFVLCGAVAASAVSKIAFLQDSSMQILRTVICIAAFVVVGILGVKFARFCIIMVTAIGGAINAVALLKTPIEVLDSNFIMRIVVIAIIAVGGIIFQKLTTKGLR